MRTNLDAIGLSKLSIPTKLILNKELLDIVLFKDDGFVDMMQEYSLFDAIIGEYSIPEIYILFEIWKIKKDKKTLDQILNKSNYSPQKIFKKSTLPTV